MQHPVGYAVGRGGSTGRADWSAPAPALQLSDFWAYLLNPWALWQYAHNMSAAVITASFVVAAVGAYWALMGLYSEHARRFLQVGVTTGFLFSLLQLFPTGDEHGKLVARHQPAALAGHGAIYLIWKTTGPVHARSRTVAGRAWIIVLVLGLLATFVTAQVQPRIYANLLVRPWTWLLLVLIVGSLAMVFLSLRRARELPAFLASSLFIASLLGATAAGQFPELLVSTLDPANDLNIYNAVAGGLGLRIGLFWWSVAILLAIGYFTYLFRSFRGKVTPSDGHGY
jgi:cytochrome bd-type quinol oxidase subunit 2